MIIKASRLIPVLAALAFAILPANAQDQDLDQDFDQDLEDVTYDENTVVGEAQDFLGGSAEAIAKVLEKVFKDLGRPNAYIVGSEAGAGLVIGIRYGAGTLHHKIEGQRDVHWTGPSIGFDIGANASRSFTLVYNLYDTEDLYSRYPSVEGSFYYIGGIGVNYQQKGDVILAPIRVGAGLRAQASIGYVHYTKKKKYIPL